MRGANNGVQNKHRKCCNLWTEKCICSSSLSWQPTEKENPSRETALSVIAAADESREGHTHAPSALEADKMQMILYVLEQQLTSQTPTLPHASGLRKNLMRKKEKEKHCARWQKALCVFN
jgi:hypothetical protein